MDEGDDGDDDGEDQDAEQDGRRRAFAKRKQTEREGRRSTIKSPLHNKLAMGSTDMDFIQAYIDGKVDRLSKLYVKGR